MAFKFIGERTIGALNGMRDGFIKDDLYRVYDAGILMPGGVSVNHGDFVSWDGTKWKLEANIKIVNTSTLNPESVPESASESNPLMTAEDTERMILENITPAANTLRFSFSKLDYSPVVAGVGSGGTWKKVNAKFHNVWDWTRNNAYWGTAFKNAFTSSDNFVSVIGCGTLSTPTAIYQMFMGNTSLKYVCYLPSTAITNFESAFSGCSSLETIEFFDTTGAVTIQSCFYNCLSLKKLPLISSAPNMTKVSGAFNGCVNVESGALYNYNTLSAVAGIDSYTNTFKDCGKNTTTGAAELAQIPSSWGGTAPASLNMGAPQNLTEPLSPSVIDGDDSLTK